MTQVESILYSRDFCCPGCKEETLSYHVEDKLFYCLHCHAEFPNFDESFPVFVPNYNEYLSNYVLTLEKKKREVSKNIERINPVHPDVHSLKKEKIKDVLETEIGEINDLQNKVCKYLLPKDILGQVGCEAMVGYTDAKQYLLRDWCSFPESEKEIHIIVNAIKEKIQKLPVKMGNALIPGCGLARFAYEFSDIFNKVFSFDYSLSMIDSFSSILKERKIFGLINSKNIVSDSQLIRTCHVNCNGLFEKDSSGKDVSKIIYYVGQAQHIPLKNNTVDAIVSIYFSDVLPLKDYIEEFSRVLKEGGILVHFGPLDYHFETFEDRLSLQELFAGLKSYGFEVDMDYQIIPTNHLEDDTLYLNGYKNILFTATKIKDLVKPLLPVSKVYFDKPFSYTSKGIFNSSTDADHDVEKSITFSDGSEFENAGDVLSILNILRDGYTISECILKINEKYSIEDKEIFDLINLLIKKKVLKV